MQTMLLPLFIAIIIFIVLLFGFFGYSFVNNIKLIKHLKDNKYSTWQDITTIGGMGAGGANPIRIFRYIYGNQDNDDDVVIKLKCNIKTGLKYSFFLLVALLIELCLFAHFATSSSSLG